MCLISYSGAIDFVMVQVRSKKADDASGLQPWHANEDGLVEYEVHFTADSELLYV